MKKPITRHESAESLYDSDFYAWTRKVSEAIRNSSLSVEDAEYAAEEIADMGKRDRRELRSRMTVLVMHLMKWAAQPRNRKGSAWLATIQEQRDQVTDLLDDSPSLRVSMIAELPIIYARAAHRAAGETGIPFSKFMRSRMDAGEVTHIDRLLSADWLPDKVGDLFD